MAKRKWFVLFAAIVVVATAVGTGVFSARPAHVQQPREQQPRVTSMPPVFSKVKKLEIVRAWIVDPETAYPAVEVEIKNNSDKDAVAIDLVCGEGAITRNGLTDDEHPVVVAKAHGTTTIVMSFGEMTFGAPLVVSAVTWADGSEEGNEKSLRAMHLARAHDRAMIKAKKELEAQKGVTKP
jgi:hypothetical protein